MPILKRPIQESVASITRPVALRVLMDMMDRCDINLKDVKVFYPGNDNPQPLAGSFLGERAEENRLGSADRMEIVVTENYIDDLLSAVKTRERGHIPLWINEDLEVDMYPIYAPVEMRITIRYRAKSRVEAQRVYDYFSMKLPDRDDQCLHEIQYMFAAPAAYEVILKEIHRLQELKAGYGETWEQFYQKGRREGYREISDMTAKNTMGVFGETQNYVLGAFDIQTVPDQPTKNDDGSDSYYVEFPYILRYEKPIDVELAYPVVIHNSVLSDRFRPREGMRIAKQTQAYRTKTLAALSAFTQMAPVNKNHADLPGRYFPSFDEFMPRNIPALTRRVFTALVTYNEDNPVMMTIDDLSRVADGMRFPPTVINALKREAPWIMKHRESVFHMNLYGGRNVFPADCLELTQDLEIRRTKPLDERKYYHIRFGLVTDLSILTDDAKDRLIDDPDLIDLILDEILPGWPKPPIKKPMTWEDFQDIVDQTRETNNPNPQGYPGQNRQMRTVQTTGIRGWEDSTLLKRSLT